ncbi:hypothetical protein SAMN05518866_1592 [Sphingobium sp. YR768]|nr:hypothetical protein SAMN05518866_1592 [Sphingobium sp. YR768]
MKLGVSVPYASGEDRGYWGFAGGFGILLAEEGLDAFLSEHIAECSIGIAVGGE